MKEVASPVLIIGARSDIGRALARHYAAADCSVMLAARHASDLESARADLEVRYGVRASIAECNVIDPHPEHFFSTLPESPKTIVMIVGLLGNQITMRQG